jgi:hypothetical protein
MLKLILSLSAATLILLGTNYYLYKEVKFYKAQVEADAKELARLDGLLKSQAAVIMANTKAAKEQAQRYKEATEDHEAFKAEFDVCEYDSTWTVPDALYERLCRGAPAPGP